VAIAFSCTRADLWRLRSCRRTATTRFRGRQAALVPNVSGLTVNMLEAGTQGRPLVLLLHGFPNLLQLAQSDAGVRRRRLLVIAPDCRGYGRTMAGTDPGTRSRAVHDAQHGADQIALVYALGYRKAELIAGTIKVSSLPRTAIVRPASFSPDDVSSAGGTAIVPVSLRNETTYTAAELEGVPKLEPPAATIRDAGPADRPMKKAQPQDSDFHAVLYMKGGEFRQPELTPLPDCRGERGRRRERADAECVMQG
jgi:pimeloyl-ACP methyl ester carboxylesterase